jgi:hypothetical protein
MRAPVQRDDLTLICELADEGLQPAPWCAVPPVDRGERRLGLLDVGLDDRGDDVVFGLEVVVDVAHGHVRGLGDVSQRCLFNALLVQQLGCGGDEALPLPARLLSRTFQHAFH